MQIFYKIFKILQSLWWVHFCWMSLLIEILAMPLQYRTWVEFMYEILSDVPPSNHNSWVATGKIVHCTVHYSCTRPVQYLNERKMENAVLCNYIDFAVIFQKKLYSTNFIIHWLRAGPGRKKFCGPGRKFRPGWHLVQNYVHSYVLFYFYKYFLVDFQCLNVF